MRAAVSLISQRVRPGFPLRTGPHMVPFIRVTVTSSSAGAHPQDASRKGTAGQWSEGTLGGASSHIHTLPHTCSYSHTHAHTQLHSRALTHMHSYSLVHAHARTPMHTHRCLSAHQNPEPALGLAMGCEAAEKPPVCTERQTVPWQCPAEGGGLGIERSSQTPPGALRTERPGPAEASGQW